MDYRIKQIAIIPAMGMGDYEAKLVALTESGQLFLRAPNGTWYEQDVTKNVVFLDDEVTGD